MLAPLSIDMSRLNAGVSGLIRKAGIESPIVIEKETGEMIKTLVRTSPPKNPGKTRADIQAGTVMKFNLVAEESLSDASRYSGKIGASGIKWYKADPAFLRGIAPRADKRGASVEELERLRPRITKTSRLTLPFRRPRRRQRVLLYQTITTKASTVKQLIKKVQTHVGRLKAGWLVAVTAGAIRMTGVNAIPAWVSRHASGARGRFVNELGRPERPAFTIANFSRGITSRAASGIAQIAVNIRAKAIATNLAMIVKGKKNIGDYARF